MGNHRFRLSDMMPNTWFYKLKDLGKRTRTQRINHPKTKNQPPPTSSSPSSSIPPKTEQPLNILSHQRKSYYFTRELITNPKFSDIHFLESPRKSPKQRRKQTRATNRPPPPPQKLVTASVSASCGCRATIESVWAKPDSTSEEYPISPPESSSDLQSLVPELGSNDGNFRENCIELTQKFDGFDTIPNMELAPIVTKHPTKLTESIKKKKKNDRNEAEKIRNAKEQRTSSVRRLSPASSPGVRIRVNSPRIAAGRKARANGRKVVAAARKSLSDSFAVVKSSADPHQDFRESMVEMILENNLRASKDLEDLLACYLQLNSDEYHEVIIEVFKQLWFDLENIRFK